MVEQLLSEYRIEELEALELYRKGLTPAPVLFRPEGYLAKAASNEQPMVFVASEESEDRMGDTIIASGWDLEPFKRNAPFLYIHDQAFPPIGTWPKVWLEGKQLLASPKWDDEDEFAKLIKGKYERGIMRAVSVGFRALEFEQAPTKANKSGGMVFKRAELVEISAVPVPAHPRALRKGLGLRSYFWLPASMPEPQTQETPNSLELETALAIVRTLKTVGGPR